MFDTALLGWKIGLSLCDMPGARDAAAAVVLLNRYLVLIGGDVEKDVATAGCLIYDCLINHWSSTPASMNMITSRCIHTAAVLDGKIVVAGGYSDGQRGLPSMECIDAGGILDYVCPFGLSAATKLFQSNTASWESSFNYQTHLIIL